MDGRGAEDTQPLPRHVAIIMDGNGRWARARGLPRTAGHRKGAEAVRRAVRGAAEQGVEFLTVFGFSAENWRRPPEEIDDLMWLLRRYLQSEIAELHKNDVRLRVIGERSRLAPDIVQLIADAEHATRDNNRLVLTIALNYGGRQEIVEAARKLAAQAASGTIAPAQIDAERLAAEFFAPDLPDPDLMIRTSGEKRLSNFLLWQAAYSEFVFLDKLWPDFDEQDMASAVAEFQRRERRYGAAVGSR